MTMNLATTATTSATNTARDIASGVVSKLCRVVRSAERTQNYNFNSGSSQHYHRHHQQQQNGQRHRRRLLSTAFKPTPSATAEFTVPSSPLTSHSSPYVWSDVVCHDRRRSLSSGGGNNMTTTTTPYRNRRRINFAHSPTRHHNHLLLLFTSRSFSSTPTTFSNAATTATIDNTINTSTAAGRATTTKTTTTTTEMIESTIEDLGTASSFNQGEGGPSNRLSQGRSKRHWNVPFVQQTINNYEQCLTNINNMTTNSNAEENEHGHGQGNDSDDQGEQKQKLDRMVTLLLSPDVTRQAIVALQRCRYKTHVLGRKVRKFEQMIGRIGRTQIDDELSLTLLEAHGKSGNVGRVIQLLTLRKERGYEPTHSEFVYAIKSIHAAGLSLRRGNNRNVFIPESDQPPIDDPTRWLDAILLNMNQRGYDLTTDLANRMINTYASTGRSAKSYHFFYRITRQFVDPDEEEHGEDDSSNDFGNDDASNNRKPQHPMASQYGRPVKIRLNMRPPPPYHKIPSQVRGKLVRKPGRGGGGSGPQSKLTPSEDNDLDINRNNNNEVVKQLKLERESDPDWSPVLTSAISFVDSLKQGGACGHDPIELDLISYTTLMKVCVYRGSLWRAMHILDDVMPTENIEPDIVSYNVLLDGLARVGDVPTQKEYFQKLIQKGLEPTKETIEAVVDGLLNLGDVGAAITFTQDAFNQYSVLPPYTTHLKILEFALGRGLVFEAKRHVYFIQQLWKWCPNQYHSPEFVKLMELTQKNPKLSRPALEKMFAYFGEEISDSDFL